jgi:two-component system chemotaxis response regulator CheB
MDRLVVLGASAGAVDALHTIFTALPPDFPAAMLVVRHIGPRNCGLPAVLARSSRLPVRHATDGETVVRPAILVAPPDHHLMVRTRAPLQVALTHGPTENYTRPAIDPLFRSAAEIFGPLVTGVLLTGYLDDGSVGLKAIKACGGTTVVQDPHDAYAPDMPANALHNVAIDYALPLDGIGPLLARLAMLPADPLEAVPPPVPEWVRLENRYAYGDAAMQELEQLGSPSTFTCPECSGALWQLSDGPPQRYRCHTGHSFTATVLAELQSKVAEDAMWAALRALQEKERMARSLAAKAAQHGLDGAAREHLQRADQALADAKVLRLMLTR